MHSLWDCGPHHELISQGQLGRDGNQKICLPGGAPLRRQQGETLLDAYHRIVGDRRGNERAAAHLVTAHYDWFKRGDINYVVATMSKREYEEFEQDDSPDEDAKEYETSTPDASWSYGAERTPRANRDAR